MSWIASPPYGVLALAQVQARIVHRRKRSITTYLSVWDPSLNRVHPPLSPRPRPCVAVNASFCFSRCPRAGSRRWCCEADDGGRSDRDDSSRLKDGPNVHLVPNVTPRLKIAHGYSSMVGKASRMWREKAGAAGGVESQRVVSLSAAASRVSSSQRFGGKCGGRGLGEPWVAGWLSAVRAQAGVLGDGS